MKKFLSIAMMCAALMASAIEPVTVTYGYGWDGLTSIPADKVGQTVTLRVEIHHWELALDEWFMHFSMPEGLELVSISRGRDLDMVVFNEDGMPYTYNAPLTVQDSSAACKIADIGYEDLNEDGAFDPYGTIKFLAGNQEVLFLDVLVHEGFESGTITIDGRFNSGADDRMYTPVCNDFWFVSFAHVSVSYDRGDVNGDGKLTVEDVTLLIDSLL